ncbi:UDP-3-O-(3-hydroxymyristoyl)glucosamine N-acyltransferase [Candidatus Tenderia electrophaga]|jgi:UDP-3-O-[3-hydroxymyristoyl] glucosamine N-acyltransferase|uniref:UDP-3-O-acylglucosamine N-acyltransferase n=1 Tax=Candidatus Tenderia electrophaga TaxID=1748243 RepID=A0A0S2TDA2_9GAMM|nr:UDP-3-O-(3-hydroxymyristoyl)glucosamine N-acyltransferase [Candidatus Tenderia electrophaga]
MTLAEIAARLACELHGDGACLIRGVATLQNATPGQIAFLANRRYRRHLATTRASAVILAADDLDACPVSALVSENPYLVYARVTALLNPPAPVPNGCHPSAVIEPGCHIDPSAAIGAHCVIGANVTIGAAAVIGPGCVIGCGAAIGDATRLTANVSIGDGVSIGRRCLVQPGAVIGSDGFGYAQDKAAWVKVPQLGGVVVGDDVEIGANTTIDRGALEDTVIEDGVILDNQIQIAHNVRIGAHTAIAGATAIAGSTRIGKRCQIGGAVGIVGHLEIVDDVYITAMSLVTGNIRRPGLYSSGTPLADNKEWRRNAARFGQLDDMARRLKALEKKLEDN